MCLKKFKTIEKILKNHNITWNMNGNHICLKYVLKFVCLKNKYNIEIENLISNIVESVPSQNMTFWYSLS